MNTRLYITSHDSRSGLTNMPFFRFTKYFLPYFLRLIPKIPISLTQKSGGEENTFYASDKERAKGFLNILSTLKKPFALKLAMPDWERLSAEGRSKRLNIGARGYLITARHLVTSFLVFASPVNLYAGFVKSLTKGISIYRGCLPAT